MAFGRNRTPNPTRTSANPRTENQTADVSRGRRAFQIRELGVLRQRVIDFGDQCRQRAQPRPGRVVHQAIEQFEPSAGRREAVFQLLQK